MPGADGVRTVALVIDEDQHRPLAEYCRIMLRRVQERYPAALGSGCAAISPTTLHCVYSIFLRSS